MMALTALETETLESRDYCSVNLGIGNSVQSLLSNLSMPYYFRLDSIREEGAEIYLKFL